MKRPLPLVPRGRRTARPARERLFLACPRLAPDWELGCLDVLMRPKVETRRVVEHRCGEQAWSSVAASAVETCAAIVTQRLGTELNVHWPRAGEFHLVIPFDRGQRDEVLALAVLISRRLPRTWFVIDRLFVLAGVFYRRRFGYKLQLVAARDVHLKRPIRAALSEELSCPISSSKPKRSKPGRGAR